MVVLQYPVVLRRDSPCYLARDIPGFRRCGDLRRDAATSGSLMPLTCRETVIISASMKQNLDVPDAESRPRPADRRYPAAASPPKVEAQQGIEGAEGLINELAGRLGCEYPVGIDFCMSPARRRLTRSPGTSGPGRRVVVGMVAARSVAGRSWIVCSRG